MSKRDLEEIHDKSVLAYDIMVKAIEDIANEYEVDRTASDDLLKKINHTIFVRTDYFLELDRQDRGFKYWWKTAKRWYVYFFKPGTPIK